MKKLVAIVAAVLVSNSIVSSAVAHQDQSFLYSATSSIFEENYDLFTFSPAYLPSFEKNAFWGQLSNLYNQSDYLVDNSATSYYLLGGHMDVMGMGRAGLMGDWYSSSSPQSTRTWNSSTTYSGFGERSYIEYRDRDDDEIIDNKVETYGRQEKTSHSLNNDIYAAYGMGNMGGFDVGIGVRGRWASYNPSYNNYTLLGSTYGGFDEYGWQRETDLITNQLIYTYERECTTGSWSYGNSDLRVILGGRSQGLMPNLDLVVNVEPVLIGRGNEYEWEFYTQYDDAPGDPNLISDYRVDYSEKGMEEVVGSAYYPANGFGVAGDVRLDFKTSFTGGEQLNNRLIADIGVETTSRTLDTGKAKKESITHSVDRDTIWNTTLLVENLDVTDTNDVTNLAYEGTVGYLKLNAKLRALWANEGWDFGLGIGFESTTTDTETTLNWDNRTTIRQDYYNTVNTDDYTEVRTESYKQKTTSKSVSNAITLPVALQLNFLKNFSVQVSASHTISLAQSDSSSEFQERALYTSVTTYDDGRQETDVTADSGNLPEADSFSSYSVYHATQFAYGVTWWPFEQVRVDFTSLAYLTYLYNYRFSVSLYY
ncbi:hypothetical protein JW933_08135 [candidate division FCPU426 bacterium]|nr:hypothetical protein [candidate division FCPU426 bacterium]